MIEEATKAAEIASIVWEPCRATAGCLRTADDPRVQRAYSRRGFTENGVGHFKAVQAPWDNPRERRTDVLLSTERTVAAWRAEKRDGVVTCGVLSPTLVGDRIAAGVLVQEEADGPVTASVMHRRLVDTDYVVHESDRGLDTVAIGTSAMFAFLLSRQIAAFDETGMHLLAGSGTAIGGSPDSLVVVGDDVFWEDWAFSLEVRVGHARVGEEAEVFLPAPEDDTTIRAFAADGDVMVWQTRPNDDPVGAVDVWVSPFVLDPKALAPRIVATLPRQGVATLGDGHYGVGGAPMHVVNLTTGDVRVFDASSAAPAVLRDPDPIWVTSEEIGVLMYENRQTSVWRIPLADLPLRED